MSSRVTDKMIYDKGVSSMASSRRKLVDAQTKASTGKRINKPSDDPVGTMKVMALKADIGRNQQLQRSLSTVDNYLKVSETNLGDLGDVLVRAKELAISMSSSVNQNSDILESAAQEVAQLALRAVQIGNTRVGNRYIFGGFKTDKAPFDQDGNYYGDDGITEVEVAPGQKVIANLPGTLPFFGLMELPKRPIEGEAAANTPTIASSYDPNRGLASKEALPNNGTTKSEDAGKTDITKSLGTGSAQKTGVITVLKDLQRGLETGNKLMINQSLDNLEAAFDQVVTSRSLVGSRQKILEFTRQSLESSEISDIEVRSETEDADALQVFSDLTKDENALNATLEVNKRLITKSLLDFLG